MLGGSYVARATDGTRLAVIDSGASEVVIDQVVGGRCPTIPRGVTSPLTVMQQMTGPITWSTDRDWMRLKCGRAALYAQPCGGDFPSMARVESNEEPDACATVDVDSLRDALRLVTRFSPRRTNRLDMKLGKDVTLSAQDETIGEVTTSIVASCTGAAPLVVINHRYLLEAAEAAEQVDGAVDIHVWADKSATRTRPVVVRGDGQTAIYTMPMRF